MTGTAFYLPLAMAAQISEEAMTYLADLASRGGRAVYAFLSGQDWRAPVVATRFLELPYLANGQGRAAGEAPLAWRVADHLLVRAGLCYALAGGFPGGEWERYRAAILLWGAELYGGQPVPGEELPASVAHYVQMAERCLTGVPDPALAEVEIDLVKASAVKIKGYFLETNKLPNIRGASRLLDILNRRRWPYLVGQKHAPECVVYAGGGNLLAVVPAGTGQGLAAELEHLFERVTVTASSVAAAITVPASALGEGDFAATLSRLEAELKRRQRVKVDWRTDPAEGDVNAGLAPGEEAIESERIRSRQAPAAEVCDHCHMRKPLFTIPFRDENRLNLCTSCYHRHLAGGREGREAFMEEYESYCRTRGLALAETVTAADMEDLAAAGGSQNHYVAMLYADGNNMGQVIMDIKGLPAYRSFSQRTERAAAEAVYAALARVQGNKAAVFVALGGDDILLLLPAPTALAVVVDLGTRFDAAFRNLSDGSQRVTLSAGIAIGHYTHPVGYMFATCQELLKSAKKRARALSEQGRPSGTLDVVAMESYTNFSSGVEDYRRQTKQQYNISTLRPFTWSEAVALAQAVRSLHNSRGGRRLAFQMRSALLQMRPAEVNLFYLYQMGRLPAADRQRVNQVMAQVARAFGGKWNAAGIELEGGMCFPWLDLLELWDYCAGGAARGGAADVGDHSETLAGS